MRSANSVPSPADATTAPGGEGNGAPGGRRRYATPLDLLATVETTERDAGLTLRASRVIDTADPHLRAHFPGCSIFPGVFLIEGLRQAVVRALGEHGDGDGGIGPRLTRVRSVHFLAPLLPGDEMTLSATVVARDAGLLDVDAHVLRRDGTAAARMKVELCRGRTDDAVGGLGVGNRLPHAHPMLLVDRVEAIEPGRSITAIKAVTRTEPCYRDLDAGLPPECFAYPAALMLESFGQAAALLWLAGDGRPEGDDVVMLTTMRNCRIDGSAYPGDVLKHLARIEKDIGNTVIVGGETWVGDRRVAVVESMMATVRSRAAFTDEFGDCTVAGSGPATD